MPGSGIRQGERRSLALLGVGAAPLATTGADPVWADGHTDADFFIGQTKLEEIKHDLFPQIGKRAADYAVLTIGCVVLGFAWHLEVGVPEACQPLLQDKDQSLTPLEQIGEESLGIERLCIDSRIHHSP